LSNQEFRVKGETISIDQLLEFKHFIVVCSAVNMIDASALRSLKSINLRLKDVGIQMVTVIKKD
jgi:anti-anti-sigma regulatory factor